jgi:hypothetical protein
MEAQIRTIDSQIFPGSIANHKMTRQYDSFLAIVVLEAQIPPPKI